MENVVLNSQQEEAVKLIQDWFENQTNKMIFTLSGSAGTGKTFLISYIIENILKLSEDEVAFIAYTGKAASVIAQRTGRETSTIHRLIYNPVEVEKIIKLSGSEQKVKKIEFLKKPSIGMYRLIVLDEISMVDQHILEDLMSYGIKTLCCGDMAQLPAIVKQNNLLESPDYNLTKIMRQQGDSVILKLAEMAKNGVSIPIGNYGDAIVVQKESLSNEDLGKILLKADQVICGTNKTRIQLNNFIRQLKGIDIDRFKLPLKGEKIICCSNNYEVFLDKERRYNLVNGTIGYCETDTVSKEKSLGVIDFKPDFISEITEDVVFDTGIFLDGVFKYEPHSKAIETLDGKILPKISFKKDAMDDLDTLKNKISDFIEAKVSAVEEVVINQFEFAYAISCHKSQGSEWDNIVIFDEKSIFRKDADKWLYTAITRARKKLIILK